MEEQELRRLAEAIQVELTDLVGDAAERAVVESSLLQALSQPAGTAHDALRKALSSQSATREWMRRRIPITEDNDRALGPLGTPTALLGVLFACPKMDYSVVRETVTDEVLLCPNDGSVLERRIR